MVQSTYETLYKGLMNINEDGCPPYGWHGLDGDRCIKRDTPTPYTPTPYLSHGIVLCTVDCHFSMNSEFHSLDQNWVNRDDALSINELSSLRYSEVQSSISLIAI